MSDSESEDDDYMCIEEKNIWSSSHVLTRRAASQSQIDEFYQEGTYTDVNIICQGRTFRCHRVALAAASEYFHSMFRGNFVESHAQNVILQDIDSTTFEQILPFIYRGEVATINDENVFSLLRASDIFRLRGIEDHCIHYLTQKNIPIDDALEIFLYACAMHKVSLIYATSRFILQNLNLFSRTEFVQMSLEDFNALLAHFRGSSACQEAKLLDAIFKWVCNSTGIFKDRKSSFTELAQKVQFKTISAAHVAEYFERNSQSSNDERCQCGVTDMVSDCDSKMEIDESSSLYMYIRTDHVEHGHSQTSILSLQEKASGGIDWHLSHTIRPAIKFLRIVEYGSRFYSLRLSKKKWTFSSSTAIDLSTDMQQLAPPSNLLLMSPSIFTGCYADDIRDSFSLCRLQKNIYVGGLHENIGIQCYSTELNEWSRIPILGEYESKIIMSDGTRLYIICRKSSHSYYKLSNFFAYDPRVGKVEELNNKELQNQRYYPQPSCYHKGKFYLPNSDTNRMNVYDPILGRWDVQNSKCYDWDYTSICRLMSFNNRLWTLELNCKGTIRTRTYDSYLQRLNDDTTVNDTNLNLHFTDLLDVIAL